MEKWEVEKWEVSRLTKTVAGTLVTRKTISAAWIAVAGVFTLMTFGPEGRKGSERREEKRREKENERGGVSPFIHSDFSPFHPKKFFILPRESHSNLGCLRPGKT